MSRQLIFFLFLFVLEAISTGAQTTIVCQGKTLRIDKKSTIVRSSKECKVCKNYILNDDAIDFVKPLYPDEARAKRISGSVAVQITVNEKGEVEPKLTAVGPLLFQPIAIEAVRKTRFKRMILDCKPAKYSGIFVINFGPS